MSQSSQSSEDTFSGFMPHDGPTTPASMSQEEVAKALGISRSAVWKAERRIMRKLRLALIDSISEVNPELALRIIREWFEKNNRSK
jgi:transcriptional regulator with XRE-family HTH domain